MLPRVDLIRADQQSWLLLNSQDHISDFIRKNGFWGINEATIAQAFLDGINGVDVIDAGANIGGFTLPIANILCEKGGRVHSFEPQRIVFQQLCANVFLNRLDNVNAYNCALGDAACEIEIPELDFWKSQNLGGFSIDPDIRKNLDEQNNTFQNFDTGSNYRVEQRSLDSFNLFKNIALIKVDVEGYELELFKGGEETIRSNGFPPIIFELWEGMSWYDEKARQTVAFLESLGYEFSKFGREILAQSPAHHRQCQITKTGNSINLCVN